MRDRHVGMRVAPKAPVRSQREGLLAGVVGGVLGLLCSCCLGVVLLSFSDSSFGVPPPVSPPTDYDVAVIIEEHTINRTLATRRAGSARSKSLATSHVDIRPDGLMDFTARLRLGPLRPILRGTAALIVTETGDVEIRLKTLKAGRLSLASLVPARLLGSVNNEVNEQLVERTAPMGLRLLSLDSDETTLHLYLISTR